MVWQDLDADLPQIDVIGAGGRQADDAIPHSRHRRHHVGTLGVAGLTQSMCEWQVVERLHPRTRFHGLHPDAGRWRHLPPEFLSADISVLRPGKGLLRTLYVSLDSRQASW